MIVGRLPTKLLLTLLTVSVIGCSKSENNSEKQSASVAKESKNPLDGLSVDYQPGLALIYVKENPITDDTCKLFQRTMGWKDAICINNKNDWKILCKNADLAISDALKKPAQGKNAIGASVNSLDALLKVAENGGAELISTEWNDGKGEFGECTMSIRYSGMHEGTTINEILSSDVWVMGITKDKKVVIAN